MKAQSGRTGVGPTKHQRRYTEKQTPPKPKNKRPGTGSRPKKK